MPDPTPPNPKPDPNPAPPAAPDAAAELAALKAELAALKAAQPKPPAPEPDLGDRARATRESAEKEAEKSKRLEGAIRFNLGAKEFLKTHESILPSDVPSIFEQAEKEKFGDAIEKDAAIKAQLIQSFFSVQANADLLTAGQKRELDEYLSLTKNGKQEKAQRTYDMIFEPAFEMLKRVKKAEALGKGYGGGTSHEDAYKNKLIAGSKKHYLGEKSNGA